MNTTTRTISKALLLEAAEMSADFKVRGIYIVGHALCIGDGYDSGAYAPDAFPGLDGSWTLDATLIKSLLKLHTGDTVELLLGEDNKAKMLDADISFAGKGFPCSFFAPVLQPEYLAGLRCVATMPAADIATGLIAANFVSKDELNPAMMQVHFSDQIAATDTYTLVWFDVEDRYKDHPFSISPMLLKALSKKAKTKEPFDIAVKKNADQAQDHTVIEFVGIGCNWSFVSKDLGRYPDVKRVIPNYDTGVTVNRKELIKLISERVQPKRKGDTVLLYTFENRLVCLMQWVDVHSNAIVLTPPTVKRFEMQTTWSTPDLAICFNSTLLLALLKRSPGEDVEIKFEVPKRAAVINNCFLIMPVELGGTSIEFASDGVKAFVKSGGNYDVTTWDLMK